MFRNEEDRYHIVSQKDGAEWVVWFDDVVSKWPLMVAEVERAASVVFPFVPHKCLVLWKDSCGVVMKMDRETDFWGDKIRHRITESNNSQSTCVVWDDDVLKETQCPVTLAEILRAVKEVYPGRWHKRLILQKYPCGVVMRVEYDKLKQDCSE